MYLDSQSPLLHCLAQPSTVCSIGFCRLLFWELGRNFCWPPGSLVLGRDLFHQLSTVVQRTEELVQVCYIWDLWCLSVAWGALSSGLSSRISPWAVQLRVGGVNCLLRDFSGCSTIWTVQSRARPLIHSLLLVQPGARCYYAAWNGDWVACPIWSKGDVKVISSPVLLWIVNNVEIVK